MSGGSGCSAANLVWLRVDGELPDDPLLHVCLMTYASDMTLLDSVLLGHGLSWADGRTSGASLDHAMWFHQPFRADRWLLYAQDSPVAYGARGLAHGEVFTADGNPQLTRHARGMSRPQLRPSLRRGTCTAHQAPLVWWGAEKPKIAGQNDVAARRADEACAGYCGQLRVRQPLGPACGYPRERRPHR